MNTITIATRCAALIATLTLIGCEAGTEVNLADLPRPAQRAIKAKVGHGTIGEIEKEKDKGRTVYDVEAKKNRKKIAFTVAEDGKILKTE
jgi:hypothetical protein